MTTFARNLILTVLMLGLAAAALLIDGLDGHTRAGVVAGCIAFLGGLWLRSGKGGDGGGPLSPVVPLACLALLAFACEPQAVGLINVVQRREEVRPLGGANTDYVRLTGQGSTPSACTSPYGCLFYSTVSNLPVLMDASGNSYTAGTVWRARQVAGTPGGVATHDIWADTSTGSLMWRSSGGNVTIGNAGGWVTVDTSQTITGDKTFTGALVLPAANSPSQTANASIVWDSDDDLLTVGTGATRKTMMDLDSSQTASGAKTFSAATTMNGNVTAGDAAADVVTIKGALRIENAANTFYASITHTATANRAVTLPDAAGAICLDTATQTLTNKTLTAPVINGATSASGNFDLSGSSGTFKTSTGAVTIGTGAINLTGAVALAGYPHSFLAHADTAAATVYLGGAGQGAAAASQIVLHVASAAQTLRALTCGFGTAPGGVVSDVVTVVKSSDQGATWSDTTVTCTVTGASKTCSDTAHTPTLAAGDWVGVKIVRDGLSVSAAYNCQVVVQ